MENIKDFKIIMVRIYLFIDVEKRVLVVMILF